MQSLKKNKKSYKIMTEEVVHSSDKILVVIFVVLNFEEMINDFYCKIILSSNRTYRNRN